MRFPSYCMVVFIFFALSQEALATPPDALSSDIVMLGGSPEKAVFLVRTYFNHGSYFLMENRWFLLAMDLTDYSFQWESQGSMMVADEDYGGVSFSKPEGVPTIVEALEDWGVESSFPFNGSPCFYGNVWDYSIRDSELCAKFGNEEFVFSGARCFDLGNLAVLDTDSQEYYISEGTPIVTEVCSLHEMPRIYSSDCSSMELTLQAVAWFEDVCLLIANIAVEDEGCYDVIFTIPVQEMNTARTALSD